MADNDPDLGRDPQRNNNFDYDEKSQDLCPYAAHTRKTNPRADLSQAGGTTSRRILRRGIPFGPELTNDEKYKKKTECDRGLLFKCYQSNIDAGFQFIQSGTSLFLHYQYETHANTH
jgi:deferrochelatase/peroxidase EfeB